MTTSHPNTHFYNRISRYYDDIAHASERESTEEGWRLLNVQPGERILEIGFGTGHSLVEFAEKAGPGGHVTGVDISDGMRQVATERIAEKSLSDRVTLDLGEVPPLSYQDGSVDAVFLSFTLELFPLSNIPEVLKEISRVLKTKGRIGVVCMVEPEDESKESFAEDAYKWMHRHFPHIVDCQPIPVVDVVEKAGFKIDAISHQEIWGLQVAALVASRSKRVSSAI